MAKRKTFSKKSINRLPKGLPVRTAVAAVGGGGGGGNSSGKKLRGPNPAPTTTSINPFEMTQRLKRPKFVVHNRGTASTTTTTTTNQPAPQQRLSALAESLSKRQESIRNIIQSSKKSNQFIDQRIGEAGNNHSSNNSKSRNNMELYASNDAKNLARLVRERTRQSKRLSKYALNGDNDDDDNNNNEQNILTHKGTAIKDMTDVDHVILSDDDENDEQGDLDAYDTEMHFGGRGITRKDASIASTYGVNHQNDTTTNDLATNYTQKKLDLDDLIIRRKTMKLDRIKSREAQITTFDAMDTSFQQLASLLQFRNKDQEIKTFIEQKRQHILSKEDQEYDDWDKEMKQYLHVDKKVAATDRTKTLEEIAKEDADQLHQLETQRLARMNGDFDEDNEDNDDDDNNKYGKKKRKTEHKKQKSDIMNPDELDTDDESDWDHSQNETKSKTTATTTTANGLTSGEVMRKGGDGGESDPAVDEDDDDNNDDDDGDESLIQNQYYKVGDRVMGNYRAKEQFDDHEAWYHGTITKVNQENGDDEEEEDDPKLRTYTIEYDDGDLEENVESQYIRLPDIVTDKISTTTTGTTTTAANINNNDDDDDDDDDDEPQLDVKGKTMELKRKRQKAMEKAR